MKTVTKSLSFLLAVIMLCGVMPYGVVEVGAATTVTITSNDVINRANVLNGTSYPAGYCMGFVSDFFAGFGATRSGACCAYTYGNRIITSTDKNAIPIGADVFFDNTGDAPSATHRQNNGCTAPVYGHIGVYIGNGNFIHVPSSGKVTVTSLSNSYWGTRFRGWGYHEYVTVGTPSNIPVGFLDGIATDARKVTVSGWAYDQDDFNRAVEIHVYIGTTCIGTGVANQYRPDVNTDWIHHGAGEYHGYEIICNVPSNLTGSQIIDVYAIDAESTHHPKLENGIGAVDIPDYVDVGTNFTALIIHAESSKMIESDINNSEIPHVRINEETGLANQLWYFERQDDGSYKISSCYDGTFLDVRNALYASGTPIQTCHDTGTDAQKWYIAEYNGGYGFISKLSNMAMDLPYNNMESSTALQMHERNQSSAQTWSIVRNENTELKGPKLTVHAGDDKTKTTFSWTSVYGAKEYALYIHKNQIGSGELIPYKAGSATGAELDLPAGTYQAYVDSEHAYDYQMGNVVTFTVLEHSCAYTSVETKPTCTETGSIVYTCTACGESYTEAIPAIGHDWYEYEYVEETCTSDGRIVYRCDNCGEKWTEVLPAIGEHDYECIDYELPTCVEDGYDLYECTVCGDQYTEWFSATGEHDYYFDEWEPPTCTEDGYDRYVCQNCDDWYDEILPAEGHDLDTEEEEPTCTESGYTMVVCRECDYVESYQEIAPYGHRYEWYDEIEATCVEDGCVWYSCEECGDEYTKILPATGHKHSVTVTTKPTCTESGMQTYICPVCEDKYVETIPATGHDYKNNVCASCGDMLVVDYGVELHVSDAKATAGETMTVDIVLDKNVGFTYLNLLLDYDETVMELVSVTNGTIVNSLTQGRSYIWAQADNAVATGVLATLTFVIKEDAPAGDYAVTAEVIECCNEDEQDVAVLAQNGTVTVVDFVYGDCNGDNAVNGKDVTRLLRYLANYDPVSGTSEFEISLGADVTGDGEINGKDVTRLLRYLANFDPVTGESSVELG